MSNAVQKTETNLPTTARPPVAQEILRSDVIIPKILLMQSMSDFVKDKASDPSGKRIEDGMWVRSTTKEIVGMPDHPLEFIPLLFTNQWMNQELVGKKMEFRGYEPRTAKNESLEWDFTKDGTDWRRTKVLTVFALLPMDVATELAAVARYQKTGEVPDLDATLLPVVIQFKSTGFKTGMVVATHFAKAAGMAQYGAKAHGYKLSLSAVEEKNDLGSFFVPQIGAKTTKATSEEIAQADKWLAVLGSGDQVKIDETDVANAPAGETVPRPKGASTQF